MSKATDRFVAAHLLAYAVALPWPIAAIPLAVHLHYDELSRLTDEADVSRLILRSIAVPTAVVFVLAHVVAWPWIRETVPPRGRRLYVIGAIALGGLGVATAAAGWGWLLAR